MSLLLTITAAEVGGLARLDVVADPAAAADVSFVLTNEQASIEQTLDPAAFTAGVPDLLRRNVAKLLAAEVIEMRRRQDGASGDLQLGTGSSEVKLTRIPDFAALLRAEAAAELAPYLRKQPLLPHAGPAPSAGPTSPGLSSRGNQDELYGPSEADRLNNNPGNFTLLDPDTGRW